MRSRVESLLSKKELLQKQLQGLQKELEEEKEWHADYVMAKWVITEAQKRIQERFKNQINFLVTLAIQSVFKNRDFTFELLFERKRNKLECKPIIREGKEIYDDVKDDLGGSILDIIGIAIRFVLWSIEEPRSRNVLILDEPMRWTGELAPIAGKFIKEVAKELGIQILMITHNQELAWIGDRVFDVTRVGKKSKVVQRI